MNANVYYCKYWDTSNTENYCDTTKDMKFPSTPTCMLGDSKPPEAVEVTERDNEGEMKAQAESEEGTCTYHTPTSHIPKPLACIYRSVSTHHDSLSLATSLSYIT